MRSCVLDGAKINDKGMLHDILADALGFPEWYGRNLDALYDCLTDTGEETQIVIENPELLECHLGNYGSLLMQVLHMVSEENL